MADLKLGKLPDRTLSKITITVSADLSDVTTGGSNVVQAEFVIDDAVTTGTGFGTAMTSGYGAVTVTNSTFTGNSPGSDRIGNAGTRAASFSSVTSYLTPPFHFGW